MLNDAWCVLFVYQLSEGGYYCNLYAFVSGVTSMSATEIDNSLETGNVLIAVKNETGYKIKKANFGFNMISFY